MTADHTGSARRPLAADPDDYRLQLETVAENATLALFIMDEHQRCTYMNRAAEKLTGFRLEELQGQALHYYVHHTRPDGTHYPLEECPIDRAFPLNMRETGEEVFVHRDGHFYPVAFTASPIRRDGRTVGTIIEVRDIGEERRAREEKRAREDERERLLRELEAQRARLATVFHEAPAYIATVRGPDHVFEIANPPYVELMGNRDVVGKPVREVLPEVARQGHVELLDRVYRTGEPYVGTEVPVHVPRGPGGALEERFINFVYQPLRGADGSVAGILAHGVDVTEAVLTRQRVEEQAVELEAQADELRAQAAQLEEARAGLVAANRALTAANVRLDARIRETERARREADASRALLDAFFDAAPVAAAFVDRELRFRRMNAALAAVDAVRQGDALGKTIREVVPHLADRVEPLYRRVLETGEPLLDLELTVARPPARGGEGHYLTSYFPVKDAAGEVMGVGLMVQDVTERRQAEGMRLEQAKLVDAVHRVGQAVAAELDVHRVVQLVTDAATELTGAQFGAFFFNVLNEKGESYTLYTISGVPREAFSRFPMPRNTQVFAPTFHGTGVLRSDDITKDPRYGKNAPYHGKPKGHLPVTSYLAVPVVSRSGEVLGGLFFGHEKPGMFQERHERLAVGIAAWAAVAMDNARLYEAEHRARAEAERANRVKSEFLATMSHELRTPLNATIGYAELMLAGIPDEIPPASQEQARRILLSARHLLELIEEILTFSRLEAGEERVDPEPVELATLVREACTLSEPLALVKGLAFECRAPDDPGSAVADVRKARQVLVNLLGNAVKFTEAGTVSLSLEVVGDVAVFRVADTGPGIAPDHLEKIFDPFWQADVGTTRKVGGTGLGLSVTRRLARLMGGEVEVESELGRGSTFTFRLPRAPVAAEGGNDAGAEDA